MKEKKGELTKTYRHSDWLNRFIWASYNAAHKRCCGMQRNGKKYMQNKNKYVLWKTQCRGCKKLNRDITGG